MASRSPPAIRDIRTSSEVVCIAEQSARAWVACEGAEVQAKSSKFAAPARARDGLRPVSPFPTRLGKQKPANTGLPPVIGGKKGNVGVIPRRGFETVMFRKLALKYFGI
jgi:hypothetical protein